MAQTIRFTTDQIVRRDFADHEPGNAMRREYRDRGGGKNLASPFNEAFSFTVDEYELLKKIRPHLFQGASHERRKAWAEFANTAEGRMFRVR